MAYAKGTDVAVEKTVSEIRTTIQRYGATAFGNMEGAGLAMIVFEMKDRRVSFKLPLPRIEDSRLDKDGRGSIRSVEKRYQAWEQACRERWRSLLLCIKAKLESVDAGIETFEDAFLAHIQMPDGMTVGEHVRPRIKAVYAEGTMQPLLPAPGSIN
jgi:hypothetical protein